MLQCAIALLINAIQNRIFRVSSVLLAEDEDSVGHFPVTIEEATAYVNERPLPVLREPDLALLLSASDSEAEEVKNVVLIMIILRVTMH
jgi:hypothetical protein